MIDWEEGAVPDDTDELRKYKQWLFQENLRLENERKRLREENLFFEKKLAILQDGFRLLEEDRRTLERQKRQLAEEQRRAVAYDRTTASAEAVRRMFDGTNNPLALRKRYRDLLKIFHPDNLFGDAELSQLINKEYARRREEC